MAQPITFNRLTNILWILTFLGFVFVVATLGVTVSAAQGFLQNLHYPSIPGKLACNIAAVNLSQTLRDSLTNGKMTSFLGCAHTSCFHYHRSLEAVRAYPLDRPELSLVLLASSGYSGHPQRLLDRRRGYFRLQLW